MSWTSTGRGSRFAVELDTFETHGGREAFERDRKRQEDLKLAGVEMTPITAHRLNCERKRLSSV
jgi:hypothetical protein